MNDKTSKEIKNQTAFGLYQQSFLQITNQTSFGLYRQLFLQITNQTAFGLYQQSFLQLRVTMLQLEMGHSSHEEPSSQHHHFC